MKKDTNHNLQANLVRIALGTGCILLIPLIMMQFSSDWDWKLSDFIVIGGLLFGTGVAYELITRRVDKKYRVVIGVALVMAMLLVWAELAVGLFGTPFAGS